MRGTLWPTDPAHDLKTSLGELMADLQRATAASYSPRSFAPPPHQVNKRTAIKHRQIPFDAHHGACLYEPGGYNDASLVALQYPQVHHQFGSSALIRFTIASIERVTSGGAEGNTAAISRSSSGEPSAAASTLASSFSKTGTLSFWSLSFMVLSPLEICGMVSVICHRVMTIGRM